MQCRDQIVVRILSLVVYRCAALDDLLQGGSVEHLVLRTARHTSSASVSTAVRRRQRGAPARHALPHRAATGLPSIASARSSNAATASESSAEDEDASTRQQRRVEFERGIFRGRADQHDGAVLHDRQEAVLLRAVETMDFIDEQERALPGLAAHARGLEHALEVVDAGKNRRNLLKMQIALPAPSVARPSSCRCQAAPRR